MRIASCLIPLSLIALAGCARSPAPQSTAAAPSAAPAVSGQSTPSASAMPGQMPGGDHMAMPTTKGSLRIVSPKEGQKITSTDIPVQVAVSNFTLSPAHVGMPDRADEGHVHAMLDGENMGVLFNFYASPQFTLEGRGMSRGPHTLVFDLASNTHMDFENTVQKVKIDYEPAKAEALPKPLANAGAPAVKIVSPADGATIGPKFTMKVQPTNFRPAYDLEGKPNLKGYGHYHVMVDMETSSMQMSGAVPTQGGGHEAQGGQMPMQGGSQQAQGGQMPMSGTSGGGMEMSGGMMSMAGMVGMPGSNSFPVDLSAWKNGRHTITIEPVQNDHTPIPGAKPATITINLTRAGKG